MQGQILLTMVLVLVLSLGFCVVECGRLACVACGMCGCDCGWCHRFWQHGGVGVQRKR